MDGYRYIPILSVRPSETISLEELPDHDKDKILPLMLLRPWLNSATLDRSVTRIDKALGKGVQNNPRNYICDLDYSYQPKENNDRAAVAEFEALKDSTNGYANWVNFATQYENLIPAIITNDLSQFEQQVERLAALERGGLALHVQWQGDQPDRFSKVFSEQNRSVLKRFSNLNKLYLLLDFGKLTERTDLNNLVSRAVTIFKDFYEFSPKPVFSVAGSSFPDEFKNIKFQKIYERQLFRMIMDAVHTEAPSADLIYSDYGGARAEKLAMAAATLFPRVDIPSNFGSNDENWYFFRSRDAGYDYEEVCQAAIKAPQWDSKLNIWGTRMILDTANRNPTIINTATKATAVRMNLHMHLQANIGDQDGYYNTIDSWSDD